MRRDSKLSGAAPERAARMGLEAAGQPSLLAAWQRATLERRRPPARQELRSHPVPSTAPIERS